MGISPLDLQTMYSQMANVAKVVADKQQGVQLAQQMQEQNIIQRNEEKARAVQKAADEDAKTQGVKPDGKNSSGQQQGSSRKDSKEEPPVESPSEIKIQAGNLGQHLDISL